MSITLNPNDVGPILGLGYTKAPYGVALLIVIVLWVLF